MDRVILTNENPNDQGGIIRNASLDWSRFNNNPVMFYNHNTYGDPIGHWIDLQFDGINWSAIPVFASTEEGKKVESLFKEGHVRSASIGGVVVWKSDFSGKPILNEQGYKESEVMVVYETSLVPIPSNQTATKLNSVKLFSEQEIEKFNSKMMEKENKKPESQDPKAVETTPVVELSENGFTKLVSAIKELFAAKSVEPAPVNTPSHTEPDGDELPKTTATLDSDSDEPAIADKPLELCEQKTASEEKEEGEEAEEKVEEQTNLISKPQLKENMEEMNLAAKPDIAVKIQSKSNLTLSAMKRDNEGERILNRVTTGNSTEISDYAIVLNSILNDRRYAAFVENARFWTLQSGSQKDVIIRSENRAAFGFKKLQDIAGVLNRGNINLGSLLNKENIALGTSDDVLATPDLTAVEWLPNVFFKLFPDKSWKNEIPIYSAGVTNKNLGVIWANINADPVITKGAYAPLTGSTYTDEAVSVKLIPFWMTPLIWQPLYMAMYRYDQMGTGWEQALMKLNTYIDDELLYILSALVPNTSYVYTTGSSFAINSSTDADAFIGNPNFTGTLKRPAWADVIAIEQLFRKQNYILENEKVILVLDPTAQKYINIDNDTKSLLTRFTNSNGADLETIAHTSFHSRSRVSLYDPASSTVIDYNGVIPTTTVSANLAFIPSQLGIALGNFDVFMVQVPGKFGYEMSADIRMGAALMRKDGKGAALYTYSEPSN